MHRSDLERIGEIIGAAGGTVLGALLHPGQGRHERLARKKARKKAGKRRAGGDRPGRAEDGHGPERAGDPAETLGLRTFDSTAEHR